MRKLNRLQDVFNFKLIGRKSYCRVLEKIFKMDLKPFYLFSW